MDRKSRTKHKIRRKIVCGRRLKVISLEKQNNSLKENLIHLQSQSMRNSLVFANIEKAPSEVQKNTTEN